MPTLTNRNKTQKNELLISSITTILIIIVIISSQLARYRYSITIAPTDDQLEFKPLIYIREISYILLSTIAFYLACKSKRKNIALTIICISILLITLRSTLLKDAEKIIYGVRIIIIYFAAYAVCYVTIITKEENITKLTTIIKLSLLAYIPICIHQTINFPPIFGETYFGSRATGVFPTPLTLSITIASFAIFIYYSNTTHKNKWLMLCVAISIASGGRAGIISCIFTLLANTHLIKKTKILIPTLLLFMPVIFSLISMSEISGREGTEDVSKDGRLALWIKNTEENFESPSNFMIGVGVGVGTNASTSTEPLQSRLFSDSAFIMMFRSFGLLGLACYVCFILTILTKYKNYAIVYLWAFFIISFSQSFPEQHPAFIISFATLGLLIRSYQTSTQKLSPSNIHKKTKNAGYFI